MSIVALFWLNLVLKDQKSFNAEIARKLNHIENVLTTQVDYLLRELEYCDKIKKEPNTNE
jgi:AAA15 family ATPase/GTPase